MERNTKTTIDKLAIGDRFYKQNDRNKAIHEKIDRAPFKTKHYTYTNWAMKDGERHPEKMRHDTAVVFLRNAYNGEE